MKLCGDNGHKAKNGGPCGFKIPDTALSCHHHAADKTRQREIIDVMRLAQKQLRMPSGIETNGFATLEDCNKVRAQVVEILQTEKHADLKRLDMILKATSGASTDFATKVQEEQNAILLQLDGHGAGLVALQRLKESPIRVLPGRRTPPSEEGTA